MADVNVPIIGIDFLAHYNLLVDARHRRLRDATTQMTAQGEEAGSAQPSVKTIAGDSDYHNLLARYPEITRPGGVGRASGHQTRDRKSVV